MNHTSLSAHAKISHSPCQRFDVRRVRPADLTPQHLSAWLEILSDGDSLDSPFLHPQFTLAVAAVRDDVEVGVIEEDGVAVGFFPFHRDGRTGRPVGLKLSDSQGVIARRDTPWDARQLVRKCGLRRWHFDHLDAAQEPFEPHHLADARSPYIDLRDGWDAYVAERRKGGSRALPSVLRKARKMGREVGPLRFEFHVTDDAVFQALIEWKSAQQKRTGALEVLRYPWVLALLERLRTTRSEGFAGVLSALYAGDELVAVHFGMRTPDLLHMWFPAYNPSHEKYSPGLILLVELGQACALEGIGRIELGKGPERYKQSFKSGDIPLAEGAVNLGRCRRVLSAALYRGREWVRASPFYDSARAGKRMLRRWRSPG